MRNYKRKTDKKPLTESLLKEAQTLIENGKSIRQAAKVIGFHESTLRSRLKAGIGAKKLGRFQTVFSNEQEKLLVEHCKSLDQRFFGLTVKSLRFLLYSYAEKNNIPHPFRAETNLAGKDFTHSFMKRNRLSLWTPRKANIARTMGFNRLQLDQYFDNLTDALHKNKFTPDCIYSMDETGIQTVPGKIPTGQKEVAKSVAAEQGKAVTVVCAMSATGHYVPPYFIFARERINLLLINNGPTGCNMSVTEKGYMNIPTFLKWLQHFKKLTNPSQERPVLLILDSHTSHTSLEAIIYARSNHIHMLSLPPHSSHKTQPLDQNFFGPLKSYYDNTVDNWTSSHPGDVLNEHHVAELFAKAFQNAATIENAVRGFNSTGIFPLDRDKFTDDDFLPAEVTDQYSEEEDIDEDNRVFVYFQSTALDKVPDNMVDQDHALANQTLEEECVGDIAPPVDNILEIPGPSHGNVGMSPTDIFPLPKIKINKKLLGKGLKSTLLTSSPHFQCMETSQEKKDHADKNKVKRALLEDPKPKAVKRKLSPDDSSFNSDDSHFSFTNSSSDLTTLSLEEEELDATLELQPGSMDTSSLLPSHSIKLEPDWETDHVESLAQEMTADDQVLDMIDSKLPVNFKTEQPEVKLEYLDQETLTCSQNVPAILTQEHSQREKIFCANTDSMSLQQECSAVLCENRHQRIDEMVDLTDCCSGFEMTSHNNTELSMTLKSYDAFQEHVNCSNIIETVSSVFKINPNHSFTEENCQLKNTVVMKAGDKPCMSGVCDPTVSVDDCLIRQKTISLDDCGSSLSQPGYLKNRKRTQKGERPHKCDDCGASFAEARTLRLHSRIHTGEKPYKCDECGACFTFHTSLKNHKIKHTGEKPFKCDVCSASFTVASHLNDHKRIHTGERPYICTDCGVSYTRASHLKSHKRIHTGERPYSCDECGATFVALGHLNHHKTTHIEDRPFKCDECGASFTQAGGLNLHKRTHTGERPYKCDECGSCFAVAGNLKAHKRIHTGERPFICGDCGVSFSRTSHLKSHERTHTGEKPYRCDECGTCFTFLGSLEVHRITHTGERPYKCDVCSASFTLACNLNAHKRIHTGERPYICEDCGVSYKRSSHLKSHKRTHTGERPYKCDECGESFAYSSKLKCHKRRHTGEKPWKDKGKAGRCEPASLQMVE